MRFSIENGITTAYENIVQWGMQARLMHFE